jgi:hypothetical protein
MPKLKYKKKGKRVCLWIPGRQLKVASQIDNVSAFLQLALDNAPDIMAWAILNDVDPDTYHSNHKLEDVVDKFNVKFPQNELTQKRTGKWQANSLKLPDVLS